VKFDFIAAEKAHYPVSILCQTLQVSRSGFYAWQRRAPSARACEDARLIGTLRQLHTAHRQAYGRPRLHQALCAASIRVSPKRVARLMRLAGLVARGRRRFRVTTDSHHAAPVAHNVLNRHFAAGLAHRLWASDITAVWTRVGWVYLAVILDVGSRRIVGWALRPHLQTELVTTALHMALATRPHPQLHHSDRGTQYASQAYRALLARHGIEASMSRAGNCWDNALVESFFSSLKAELLANDEPWPTFEAGMTAVADYIRFYNEQRLHSTLNYLTPVAYEATGAVA
jgi:putative transposase